MEPNIELWIPREVGTEQLVRQINKYTSDYSLRVIGATIRFSCDDPELYQRVKDTTPRAREIYVVT